MSSDSTHGNLTAIVTGAGSGIGRDCAMALSRSHSIGLLDWDEQGLQETRRRIEDAGGRATVHVVDVRDGDAVSAAVSRTAEEYGPISAGVNAAGIQGQIGPLGTLTSDQWRRVLDINLTGVFHSMKAELENRAEGVDCSIVNIASNFGILGKTRISPYVASKHGVVGLTKAAALDYATQHVRVNAVCPGPIKTPLLEGLTAAGDGGTAMLEEVTMSVPMGRLGEGWEIADVVVWLCSASSSFVTGAVIAVDGGFVAGK